MPVAQGADGILRIADLRIFCTVVWSKGGVYGLKFQRPLTKEQILLVNSIASDPNGFELMQLSGNMRSWR